MTKLGYYLHRARKKLNGCKRLGDLKMVESQLRKLCKDFPSGGINPPFCFEHELFPPFTPRRGNLCYLTLYDPPLGDRGSIASLMFLNCDFDSISDEQKKELDSCLIDWFEWTESPDFDAAIDSPEPNVKEHIESRSARSASPTENHTTAFLTEAELDRMIAVIPLTGVINVRELIREPKEIGINRAQVEKFIQYILNSLSNLGSEDPKERLGSHTVREAAEALVACGLKKYDDQDSNECYESIRRCFDNVPHNGIIMGKGSPKTYPKSIILEILIKNEKLGEDESSKFSGVLDKILEATQEEIWIPNTTPK